MLDAGCWIRDVGYGMPERWAPPPREGRGPGGGAGRLPTAD